MKTELRKLTKSKIVYTSTTNETKGKRLTLAILKSQIKSNDLHHHSQNMRKTNFLRLYVSNISSFLYVFRAFRSLHLKIEMNNGKKN